MKENLSKEYDYLEFKYTGDGSVGLYNHNVEDVYHSIYGAKDEGWEKFILPLDFENNFSNKKDLKVLDICYGIGYNTKALLKKLITSKYNGSVKIDILEYDKNLVTISPFIKDGYFNSYPEISFAILYNIYEQIVNNKLFVKHTLSSSKYNLFIEPFYRKYNKKYIIKRYSCDLNELKQAFVHNIYYHCISQRKKKSSRAFRMGDINITPYIQDARKTVITLNSKYDIIFLDAFTPTKLPTLWTLDFFKQLYSLSNKDCLLTTYSNSAAIRHALTDAGFFVGKLYDKNMRHCGTIASPNPNLIKVPLSDFDIGLMKTSAGVYYRDENLNASAEDILEEHAKRKLTLNLESSSQYIKRFKNKKENK